jgi:hypothetical protein
MLESRLRGNAKFAMEQDGINPTLDPFGFPTGNALVDKGMYNLGVRPIAEDLGRGADDGFGFPLSLAALALRNGGYPVEEFSDPREPVPPLPATLIPFVNDFPIGVAHPNFEQTTFLPDTISPTVDVEVLPSGTYPDPNRVARMGSFKVPQLKNVELTGPYFHNGGVLTLRQLVDFYSRGGDFPVTNADHRDPLIVNLHIDNDALFTDSDKAALVDFLLSFTDERTKFARAPFDHPEIIVPIDGAAPDNDTGPDTLLADGRFLRIEATGAAGRATPLQNFLGISSVEGDPGPDHFDAITDFGDPPGVIACSGDGSSTPCPCGNESASPDQGCLTSNGSGITIVGGGTTSIADDDMSLTSTNVPIGNTGIYYVGQLDLSPGNALFDGLQCASGNGHRFAGQFSSTGTVSDTGFVAQHPVGGAYFVPGGSYVFQYFTRDAGGSSPCGFAANFSPGYLVTMTP